MCHVKGNFPKCWFYSPYHPLPLPFWHFYDHPQWRRPAKYHKISSLSYIVAFTYICYFMRSENGTSSWDIVTFYISKESLDIRIYNFCLRSLSKFGRLKVLLGRKPQTKITRTRVLVIISLILAFGGQKVVLLVEIS